MLKNEVYVIKGGLMKVIFFCGHRSPYGRAHLKPILKSKFEILSFILATEERWAYFRSALSGKSIQCFMQRNSGFKLKQSENYIIARLPNFLKDSNEP